MLPRARFIPLVVATLGAAALVAITVDASADQKAAPTSRPRAHPTRPLVTDRHEVVYADLPLLASAPYAKCNGGGLLVSVEHHDVAMYVTAAPQPSKWQILGLPADANLRLGKGHYVPELHSYGPTPFAREGRSVEAEWVVLDRSKTTADDAEISRCTSRAYENVSVGAATIESGHAKAIVPGRVYAYRRCVARCERGLDSEARVEELGVITSPAIWISSSGWGSNGHVDEDSFGRGFATVQRGTNAAIVIGLPPENAALDPLRSLDALRSFKVYEDADTFDVEVVWPADGEPTMSVFEGHAEGVSSELAAPG